MSTQLELLNGIRYELALVVVGHRPHLANLLTGLIIGKKYFFDLAFVLFDDLIGRFQNILRAPIVLFQLHDLHLIIIFLKLQDVLNGSSPKTINALRIIPHHTNIFVHRAQQFYDLILGGVRILILIDQDVLEFLLVLRQTLRNVPQQLVELQKQVVKIHRPVLETALRITLEDLTGHRTIGTHVFLLDAVIVAVLRRTHQGVLGSRDPVINGRGLVLFVIQMQFLNDRLQYAFRIIGVVDREMLRIPDAIGLKAKNAGKN